MTERMEVCLDDDDRLLGYDFTKRTCGQGVGAADLLSERLVGLPLEAILGIDPASFATEEEGIEEFLTLKHLIALQSTLEVYRGLAPCGVDAMCAASEIEFDGTQTLIQTRILVDLVTDAIRACGRCKGCGTPKG